MTPDITCPDCGNKQSGHAIVSLCPVDFPRLTHEQVQSIDRGRVRTAIPSLEAARLAEGRDVEIARIADVLPRHSRTSSGCTCGWAFPRGSAGRLLRLHAEHAAEHISRALGATTGRAVSEQ